MIIRIKRRIMSQNVRDRKHWTARHRDRELWIILLRGKIGGQQRAPETHRRVLITSYRAQLIKDHGNLVGGAKGLVDAMVAVGLLRDDADQWASIRYEQIKCPRVDDHTCIEIDGSEAAATPAQLRREARRMGL